MSAEFSGYGEPYYGEDLEPATEEAIAHLTTLAERALDLGDVITDNGYPLSSDKGEITLSTRLTYESDTPVKRHILSVHGPEHTVEDPDVLFEYVYDDTGILVDQYIRGTDEDDNPLELLTSSEEISEICRAVQSSQDLDPAEAKLVDFIKYTALAIQGNKLITGIDTSNIGRTLEKLVDKNHQIAMTITSYYATVANQGELGVTGYLGHHTNEDTTLCMPKLVVTFKEAGADVTTDFIIPTNGRGEPELVTYPTYPEDDEIEDGYDDEDYESEDEANNTPTKQGVELLTGCLVSVLAEHVLNEIQLQNTTPEDRLYNSLTTVHSTYRAFQNAAKGSEEQQDLEEQLEFLASEFKEILETRYHLTSNPIIFDETDDHKDHTPIPGNYIRPTISDQVNLLKSNNINLLRIRTPFVWTRSTQTGKPLIIPFEDYETLDITYVDCGFRSLDDEFSGSIYDGVVLLCFFELDDPVAKKPYIDVEPTKIGYTGLIPFGLTTISDEPDRLGYMPTSN